MIKILMSLIMVIFSFVYGIVTVHIYFDEHPELINGKYTDLGKRQNG